MTSAQNTFLMAVAAVDNAALAYKCACANFTAGHTDAEHVAYCLANVDKAVADLLAYRAAL
jgi:hypothetical protein